MKRMLPVVPLSVGVAFLMLGLASCGGRVSVTVSPDTAIVKAGEQQQFHATVTGGDGSALKWEVNGIIGGSPLDGTITNTGLYTAPIASTSREVAVSAVATARRSKAGIALVTVSGTAAQSAPDGAALPLPR